MTIKELSKQLRDLYDSTNHDGKYSREPIFIQNSQWGKFSKKGGKYWQVFTGDTYIAKDRTTDEYMLLITPYDPKNANTKANTNTIKPHQHQLKHHYGVTKDTNMPVYYGNLQVGLRRILRKFGDIRVVTTSNPRRGNEFVDIEKVKLLRRQDTAKDGAGGKIYCLTVE